MTLIRQQREILSPCQMIDRTGAILNSVTKYIILSQHFNSLLTELVQI